MVAGFLKETFGSGDQGTDVAEVLAQHEERLKKSVANPQATRSVNPRFRYPRIANLATVADNFFDSEAMPSVGIIAEFDAPIDARVLGEDISAKVSLIPGTCVAVGRSDDFRDGKSFYYGVPVRRCTELGSGKLEVDSETVFIIPGNEYVFPPETLRVVQIDEGLAVSLDIEEE